MSYPPAAQPAPKAKAPLWKVALTIVLATMALVTVPLGIYFLYRGLTEHQNTHGTHKVEVTASIDGGATADFKINAGTKINRPQFKAATASEKFEVERLTTVNVSAFRNDFTKFPLASVKSRCEIKVDGKVVDAQESNEAHDAACSYTVQ